MHFKNITKRPQPTDPVGKKLSKGQARVASHKPQAQVTRRFTRFHKANTFRTEKNKNIRVVEQ